MLQMYSVGFFGKRKTLKFTTVAKAIKAACKSGFKSEVYAGGILYALYSPTTGLDLRAPASFTPTERNRVARAAGRS